MNATAAVDQPRKFSKLKSGESGGYFGKMPVFIMMKKKDFSVIMLHLSFTRKLATLRSSWGLTVCLTSDSMGNALQYEDLCIGFTSCLDRCGFVAAV